MKTAWLWFSYVAILIILCNFLQCQLELWCCAIHPGGSWVECSSLCLIWPNLCWRAHTLFWNVMLCSLIEVLMFWRNILLPSSGLNTKPVMQPAGSEEVHDIRLWRWKGYISIKHQETSARLHSNNTEGSTVHGYHCENLRASIFWH
jgi:hypothetical protein